jgi:phosphoribosylglycinamide formyltransferase-1
VPVLPGDDEAALAARVLHAEHRIFPLAVRWFVEDRLVVQGGLVTQRDGLAQWLFVAPEDVAGAAPPRGRA